MRFIHDGKTYEGVELTFYRTSDLDLLVVAPRNGSRLFFIITADAVRQVEHEQALSVAARYGLSLAAQTQEAASAA